MKNEQLLPIHASKPFFEWLNLKEEKPADQLPLTSTQLAECLYYFLQLLQDSKPVLLSDLARVHQLYPQGLLSGRPKDPQTLASAFSYVMMRLPTTVLREDLVGLHLSTDTSSTMATPHTAQTKRKEAKRKHPPARSRWYTKSFKDEGGTVLTFELRDVHIQEPTDGFEVLSWLGTLEQVRVTLKELEAEGVSIDAVRDALRSVYRKHIESEIEMLRKKLVFPHPPKNKMKMKRRLQELLTRIPEVTTLADSLFDGWLQRDDALAVTTQYQGQLVLGKEDFMGLTSAQATAELIDERLRESELPAPTDVLFGNDFSMRIFLCTGLFSDEEFETLRILFATRLAEIEVSLNTLNSEELRIAAERFFLVQQLSQYKGREKKINNLKSRMFSIDTFRKIGITRLIATNESPLADPVDIIVPKNVDTTIMAQLPVVIRDLLQKIQNNSQTILSVPYTLGNLTATTTQALQDRFPSIENIGFIGKVGNASTGDATKSKVGDLVLPRKVQNQFDDEVLPVKNNLNGSVLATGYPTRFSHMLTTAALTFQEPGEMERVLQTVESDEIVTLDVELFHLMTWYQSLDETDRERIGLYLLYYISDKTVLPKYYDPDRDENDKISASLGTRGSVALFIALLTVLDKLADRTR